MKILAVSDQVIERIYTLTQQGYFRDIDLILGCGDLPYTYLEYLVSMLNVPMLYVPGNHDPEYNQKNVSSRAEGGSNIDLKSVHVKGLLIAGLGGSIKYRPDGINQYSQTQAYRRAFELALTLIKNRLRYGRALDILITHSPPFGIHDEESDAHTGLKAVNWILRWAKPRYHLHGHTHFFRQNLAPSVTQSGTTTIMNVFPYKVIEIENAK